MGERSSYGPGTFCWVNLSSTDPQAAKRFYAGLFGWSYDDSGRALSMARRFDANVAGIYGQEEQERQRGLGPHWNTYISVSDTDATTARARELGGTVLDEPFDVSDAGRTATIIDPTGAMFWVWQARRHIGAGHVNDTGCLTWNELTTNDSESAIDYYSSLFGWTFDRVNGGEEAGYWVIGDDSAAMGRNGGMRATPGEGEQSDVPPMWIPYFAVDSANQVAETAQASGGNVQFGVARVGAGDIAVIDDPTGAVFGVFEGELDD